nr:HAD family hydrolase [Streptomyces sp. SID5770]
MRVQLLALFDLDDTLINRRDCLRGWARDFAATRGLPVSAARAVVDALDARARPDDFADLRLTLELQDSVESLWAEYVSGMAQRARCRDGVHNGLRTMKADGWAIGIATNGAPDIQRAKLAGAGLAELVDGVCASGEVGRRKPGRAVFEEAARRCGASLANGGWMVGDKPGTDMEGGRVAGLRTLWVSDERQWPEGIPRPDATVPDALEAVGHLIRWGRSRLSQSLDAV